MNRRIILKAGANPFAKSQELNDLMTEIESAKSDRDACEYGSADWYEHDKALKTARAAHDKCLRTLGTDE